MGSFCLRLLVGGGCLFGRYLVVPKGKGMTLQDALRSGVESAFQQGLDTQTNEAIDQNLCTWMEAGHDLQSQG